MEDRLLHNICLPHSHDCPIIVDEKRKFPLWSHITTTNGFPVPQLRYAAHIAHSMPFLFGEASTFVIPQSRLPLLFCRAHLSHSAIWTVPFSTHAYPQPVTREPVVLTEEWRLIEGKPDWMMIDEINEVEETEDVYENWRRRMNKDRGAEGVDDSTKQEDERRAER